MKNALPKSTVRNLAVPPPAVAWTWALLGHRTAMVITLQNHFGTPTALQSVKGECGGKAPEKFTWGWGGEAWSPFSTPPPFGGGLQGLALFFPYFSCMFQISTTPPPFGGLE